jgi:hypothetical protein
MLLTHSITHNGQILEISVYYTPSTNTVTEIKSIWVHSLGGKMPVTIILMHLFETEINKIVSLVDWREIYRGAMGADCFHGETNGVNMNNVNKHIAGFLAPHVNS